MKIFILFAILGMMLFSACTEQDIEPFGERHEVYFYKYFMDEEAPGTAKADSTDVTFFFAKPTDDHVMAEIVVALAGRPLTKDLHFGLKVVKDMTSRYPFDERCCETGMVDPGSFCRVAGKLFILEIQDIPGEYTGSIQFGWKYDKECS